MFQRESSASTISTLSTRSINSGTCVRSRQKAYTSSGARSTMMDFSMILRGSVSGNGQAASGIAVSLDRGLAEGTLAEATQVSSKNVNIAGKIRTCLPIPNAPGCRQRIKLPARERSYLNQRLRLRPAHPYLLDTSRVLRLHAAVGVHVETLDPFV